MKGSKASNHRVLNPEQKDWLLQLRTLSRKAEQSQKSSFKLLSSLTNAGFSNKERDILQNLTNEFESTDNHSNKESTLITNKMNKIFKGLRDFKQILKSFEHTEEYLVKVQKVSTGVYQKLEALKTDMVDKYDELDEQNERIDQQLELAERRVQGILEGNQEDGKNLGVKERKNENKNRNSEGNQAKQQIEKEENSEVTQQIKLEFLMKKKQQQVEEVDGKIRQLGRNLGWPEEDHKDFITIWNRCGTKNYFQIEDQLSSYFNFYTGEQIRDHMNKHLKHKKLLQDKKNLIGEYKQLKEQKKEIELAKLQSEQYEKQSKLKKQAIKRQKVVEQKQMKEKVQEWKKKKEQQKKQEGMKEKMIRAQRNRAEQLRRRQEAEKRKEVLERWKQDKQKERQIKSSRKRPSSAINKETMERIRQREQKMKQEQMQKLIAKKMQEEQILKKQEKMKQGKMIKYAHVNSKLEEKTTAIKQKERSKFDGKTKKDANTFGGQLLLTGMRAVPEWRQGL